MAFFCPQCNASFETFEECSQHISTSSDFNCNKWRFHPELQERCQKTPTKNVAVARLHSAIKKREILSPTSERQVGDIVFDSDGQPLVNAEAGMLIREVLSKKKIQQDGLKVSKANGDLFLSFGNSNNVISPLSATIGDGSNRSAKRKRNDDNISSTSSDDGGSVDGGSDDGGSDDVDSDDGGSDGGSSGDGSGDDNSNDHCFPKCPLLRLHNEILDFVETIQPTKSETENRMLVVSEIEYVARELFKNDTFKVEIFGSTLTGLALPTSDVDIVITGLPYKERNCILKLGNELKRRGLVSYMELITGARVPIIKMTHLETGTDADICFNQTSGPRMGAMIKHMLGVVPAMKPLVLVLKYFLAQRSLNITFKGGVGSFLLQLMVIASIQHHAKLRQHSRWKQLDLLETNFKHNNRYTSSPNKKRIKKNVIRLKNDLSARFRKKGPTDLGTMLLEFLEFYGRSLDIHNVGISVRGQGALYRKNTKSFYNPNRTHLLSLENPENPNIDIGANSYDYRKVNRALSNAYESVKTALNREQNFIKNGGGKNSSNSGGGGGGGGDGGGKSLLSLIIDVDAARTDSRTHRQRQPMSRNSGGRSGGGNRRGRQ